MIFYILSDTVYEMCNPFIKQPHGCNLTEQTLTGSSSNLISITVSRQRTETCWHASLLASILFHPLTVQSLCLLPSSWENSLVQLFPSSHLGPEKQPRFVYEARFTSTQSSLSSLTRCGVTPWARQRGQYFNCIWLNTLTVSLTSSSVPGLTSQNMTLCKLSFIWQCRPCLFPHCWTQTHASSRAEGGWLRGSFHSLTK